MLQPPYIIYIYVYIYNKKIKLWLLLCQIIQLIKFNNRFEKFTNSLRLKGQDFAKDVTWQS